MNIRKQDGFSAVAGALVLVIVIVLIMAGWYVFQKQQTNTDKSSQPVTKNQSITEIVADVKAKVSKDVPTVKMSGADDGNYNSYVSYKVPGYDYLSTVETKTSVNYAPKNPAKYVTEDQGAKARLQNEKTLNPVKDVVIGILQENGFKKVANYSAKEIINNGAMYERKADVCAVNINWLAAGISCAMKEEIAEVAKEVKPFVDAFRNAKINEPSGTAFALLESGTGTTENDKYAVVSTRFAGAYFYQENGKWVYFTSSLSGIGCAQTYSNPVAERAFSKTCRKPGEGI